MAYNLTWMDTTNNLYDVTEAVNNTALGLPALIFLVGISIFVYSKTINDGVTKAMISASFTATIIGTLLWLASLLPWYILVICIVTLIGSVIKRFFER